MELSKDVYLANNQRDLIYLYNKISAKDLFLARLKEWGEVKHRENYNFESSEEEKWLFKSLFLISIMIIKC